MDDLDFLAQMDEEICRCQCCGWWVPSHTINDTYCEDCSEWP